MQKPIRKDRRTFIKDTILIAVSLSLPGMSSCKKDEPSPKTDTCKTTDDILGPFYQAGAPLREDITPEDNGAAPLTINGKVYSNCDSLLENAMVEIWNADENGEYDSSQEYRFRGRYVTLANGLYSFRTIIPGRYLNGSTYRPSHIHFRITAPGHEELISQIYFKDDPFIDDDPWASSEKAVERILTLEKDANGNDTVTFDIHLTPA
jgi:protocatechuate 3,4-dioxygenase beta subunit